MRAPTHITGPDGTVCHRGEEIPEDWFEVLPDLEDHLAAISGPEVVAEETPKDDRVRASATVTRKRGSA